MTPDINKLKEVLQKYDEQRWKLQGVIKELEEVPKYKAVVGKYFKYLNAYSSKEQWWMYFHIKDYKNNYFLIDTFEKNTRSEMKFELNKQDFPREFSNPNYIEITKKEYDAAVKKLIKSLNKHFK